MKSDNTIFHRLAWCTSFSGDFKLTAEKLFLAMAVALTAITSSATEKWIWVDSSEILGGYTIYAEQASLIRRQSMVRMSHLISFSSVNFMEGKPFLSLKGEHEYDCECGCHRQIAYSLYSQKMAAGEIVFANNLLGQWLPVLSGSTGSSLWKFACRNRQL